MTAEQTQKRKVGYLDMEKHLTFPCIPDKEYVPRMRELVEPYLSEQGQHGILDGLYYEFYPQQAPKGTIVICYGFTESCEKYHELIFYMHREGYQVAIMDYRGHGNSAREVEDPELVHVDDFAWYVKDLHRFIQNVVRPKAQKRPIYLFAHSMGGCVGALYLEQYPGIFRKAVLSAPMFGINNGDTPDWAASLLCWGAGLIGKKKKKLFTMGDFDEDEPFETCGCNSKVRHEYYRQLRKKNKHYQTSAATYGWARQAMKAAKRAIDPDNAKNIKIPVLLFSATEDDFVRAEEQDLFLERIPNGRKIVVKSRHEIARHNSGVLEPYLALIFEFFA